MIGHNANGHLSLSIAAGNPGLADRSGNGSRTSPATYIVNYHGVGSALRDYEPGEAPFWLTEDEFDASLEAVRIALRKRRVMLTFDDGNLSDYTIAAPALVRRGLTACFFVVAGRLGSRGFMGGSHLRQLVAEGFEIGSHGLGHVDWTQLDAAALAREVQDSKAILEDTIGHVVRRAAIPFGRYDRRVLQALRDVGYDEVLSSDGGPRLTAAWPVPRRSIREGISAADLPRLIDASFAALRRLRCEGQLRLKSALNRNRPN